MSTPSFTWSELEEYRKTGHVTRRDLFKRSTIQSVLDDLTLWSGQFVDTLDPDEEKWFLERGDGNGKALRKLDHPAFHREPFRELATHTSLKPLIEQLLGSPCHLFFSQVFMKPPEAGSPKPIHQDNFYWCIDDANAITMWIAMDKAGAKNGGVYYYVGSHKLGLLEHKPSCAPGSSQTIKYPNLLYLSVI